MKLKLVEKRDEAYGTKSFFWLPSEAVSYYPGQYFYFTLPSLDHPDKRGLTRHFTISASPTESNLLRFTTRIRKESGFKMTLDKMPIGSEITGSGPNGTFYFDESLSGSHVFIAGGIGITPYRSIIKYCLDKNLDLSLHLIYSNSGSEFVFKNEFDDWVRLSQNLKINYLDTSVTGHINADIIQKNINDWGIDINSTNFWITGAPGFVDTFEREMEKVKISADKLRSEKFTGY